MYSVDLVSDSAGFAALQGEWNEAVERAGIAHPFVRHEWLRAWWEAFGNPVTERLHILVVRRDSRVTAIAPLLFECAQMYGVPVRRLRLLQNDYTPRTDMIVAEDSEAPYRAIWDALRTGARRWDVLQLSQLPADSQSLQYFRCFGAAERLRTGTWKSGNSPYVTLGSTWQAYQSGLRAKFRQNLRNRFGRLAAHGRPVLEVVADPAAIHQSAADAERLEASGWKAMAGTAIAVSPPGRRFFALLTERAAECSWLRLLFLSVGGRRVAGAYAAVYANRLFLLKIGYDPAFAKCSPFKLLTSLAIEHAFEQGFSEFDFLGDAEPWKLEWTSATRAHDWLFLFAGTPRGRLLHPLKFHFAPAIRRCTFQPSKD